MKKFKLLFIGLLFITSVPLLFSQTRKEVTVPKVDPAAITIDGQMNEAEWQTAASADLITNTGYEIWTNKYYREDLTEPEYDELYARMLWAQDTLYVFVVIDEFVNDSTNLYWNGQWTGDQLFVSLSNRLGRNMKGWYDGNVYAAPDGPYHFLILGDEVTLNAGNNTYVPVEYRKCLDQSDSVMTFDASNIARWATHIDTLTGLWHVEMAIYNPNVNAQSNIGFNIGGSTGSRQADEEFGDAYAYYTWQPNVPNDPYNGDPVGEGRDPGAYNLADSKYWAVLTFEGDMDDIERKELNVPFVNPEAITLDANMDEPAWQNAAEVNLITNTGYEIWTNKYYREDLTEPEYDELYARLLWSQDTLYVFINIDEFVNDSTNLYWNGQWTGDQLFVSLSNRAARNMMGWYDGNVYAAPDGPYHFLIMGDEVTLNANNNTYVPEQYRGCFGDSVIMFDANNISRWATSIDTTTGLWKVEMAIYNPHVASQSSIGFNIGGSTGSRQADEEFGDAYAYYTWQPNVPNDPYNGDPVGEGRDPGAYNLADSKYWAVLNFVGGPTSIRHEFESSTRPEKFALNQNYPNPFNPTTTIRFDVAKSGSVSLKIYNVVGQVVGTLVEGQDLEVGTHSVTWDASQLSSGVYFYVLQAEGVYESKKMMLLK
jgi:hypothetical protein